MSELQQINPALLAHVVGTEVFIGQTVRSAVALGGPAAEILPTVSVLRHPFDLDSPPPGTAAVAQRLSYYGCLVAESDVDEMQRDRAIAAWSLFGGSPTTVRTQIAHSSVAILGLGGVGTAVAVALAKTGVGRFALFDSDCVEEPNLNKSSIFYKNHIGTPKVDVLAGVLQDIGCSVSCFQETISDYSTLRERVTHAPDAIVWAGDNDERAMFLSLACSLSDNGTALVTGGVVEHTIAVGPTLMAGDISVNSISASHPLGALEALLRAANRSSINPGTHVAVHLAGNLIANEVLSVIGACYAPPLRRRVLLLDLSTLDTLVEPFSITNNAIIRR
ncbi:ThiF family adenylyltransferase [Modicisalibacter xianhensis]|uniref:ThiF family protein n=1 Tax=Modicisalibacter xianhensis TaxID=442341 RepID=A0A1I3G2C9_9GAMM|nr:ThiF family adenylyltransferase [Halomonas xianhensis]SFI17633.1 ThiF family protein [Halomonas xianhensis]